jgi:uncharacterized membrane protein YeaQ/YmgE (transglycosylase-associated protein family)
MTLDQVVTWVVVGALAGFVAGMFVRGAKTGLLGTIAIGMLGALVGGWLFQTLHFHIGTGLINDIVAAIVGSVLLLLLLRLVRRL